MRIALLVFAISVMALTAPAGAVSLSDESQSRMSAAQVVILGEVHDNPAHHVAQTELTTKLNPSALVFEMLTPEQAARVTPGLITDRDALATVLDWAGSGWPDFEMYYPIFASAPGATVFGGGVPRAAARAAMQSGVVAAFGEEAGQFGLDIPLDASEQTQREALQFSAHCDALPEHLLPAMVSIQRLRDARLAQAALQALDETGGPVVVITGNGHARADWGIPRYLRTARPGVTIFALGQSEAAQILPGAFDAVLDAPAIDRPDPCLAFRD